MNRNAWPRIVVLGAGAVGCYYGGLLARAGAAVTLVARPPHLEALQHNGLDFDGLRFHERIAVGATGDASAVRDADWVLFAVKSTDTGAAAREMAPHLGPRTVVIGLQNGVDNLERIRAILPNPVVPAVVYVAAAMSGPGALRHTGRGDLVIGPMGDRDGQVDFGALASVFERAGIGCRVSDNVEGELWVKLLMNCAYNPVSALGRSRYKSMAARPDVLEVIRAVVKEVLAVAQAAGVALPPGDHVEAACRLADSMPEATSSTAQDLARGRRTEIDHLNGYIVRRGAELGVPVPVNATLHTLVRLLESNVLASAPAGA